MQLRDGGFWARLYRGSRKVLSGFGGNRFDTRLYNTDLCTFVRTVFLWAPLILAINAVVLAFAAYASFQLLMLLWLHLTIVGGICAFLISLAIAITASWYFGVFATWAARKARSSETAAIAVGYIKAKKSAICPLITFSEG